MKEWINYSLDVNGLEIETTYNEQTVKALFLPLLRQMTQLHKEKNGRILVFMAAPPAVGKTTLSLFLEYLSKTVNEIEEIQTIGLDGFHFHSDYIATHSIERNGKEIPMKDVKGCPETFDIEKLKKTLAMIKVEDITWPIYSRKLHDVVGDAVQIQGNIILLEGNWLLLDEEKWNSLSEFCDLSIMIHAEESMLEERLIKRKIQGGLSKEEAEAFYAKSDSLNVRRVLRNSKKADIEWCVLPDNDYEKWIGE